MAFAIQIPLQKIIKHSFKRQRPHLAGRGIKNFVAPPDKYSFPSGHTAGAVIIATLLAYMMGIEMIGLFGLSILTIWALGVGLSRIYNGVHYTSDVLAGAAFGGFSAWLSIWICGV